MNEHYAGQLVADGYAVIPDALSHQAVAHLSRKVADLSDDETGTRRLLDIEWCAEVGERLRGDERFIGLLPSRAVQCTLFVKSTTRNWLVALHQDLSIPVAKRVESSQCSGWSDKRGRLFVQPPVTVLEQLVAVRLHLDDCDEQNRALRVVPGSQAAGRLGPRDSLRERSRRGERLVPVPRGGAMIMKPLLLHASSKATSSSPRRVLHFVFGPAALPEGLSWPAQRGGDVPRAGDVPLGGIL